MRSGVNMSTWIRPSNVPFPSTWATFEGRKEINGSKRTYWIQDITDEYKDQVVKYMLEEFMGDEPLCKYSNERAKPGMLDAFKKVWDECLCDKLGLVCLTRDEEGKPTIAAINCTAISTKDEKDELKDSPSQIFQTLNYVKKEADPFNKLNVTEYLDAMGLYVLPKYRGEGLGLELLKARVPLSKACGLTASVTLFTSVISQKLADRAGFKDLYSIDYVELAKIGPNFVYPGIVEHTKTLRFMYILYK